MELKDLFHKQIAFFNEDLKTKEEVIDFLASKLVKAKFVKDESEFKDAVWKRENQDSTGIGDGIAIPHVLNPTVNSSAIAFVKLKNEIDWQSLDGKPTDLVFMIMTNGKDGNEHLEALANLSGFLVKQEIQAGLRNAKSVTEVQNLLSTKIEKTNKVSADGHYDVIAITACPTGIAHTYLAAEKIEEYASNLGMSVKVETQGRRGVENKLTKADIENAKVIILAHDKAINGMARFNGVKVLDTTTKDAIYNGKDLIEKFDKNQNVKLVENAKDDSDDSVGELSLTQFKKVKDNLLAGVSRMLPFVVAGGVILGFGFLLDYIYTTAMGMTAIANISDYVTKVMGISQAEYNEVYQYISTPGFDPENSLSITWNLWNNKFGEFNGQAGWTIGADESLYYAAGSFGTIWGPAHFFSGIGKVGMELMIPILAGYVCYSIVGPQGLMVGATAGLFANGNGMVYGTPGSWAGAWSRFLPDNIQGLSSGFIGALVGAYLGALAVYGWTKLMKNFGKGLQGARDIVFIPVLSLLSVAIIMLAINIPLGYVMLGLQEGITFMAEKNLMFIVCTIIALMMCVDMGGPINKIAYTLGVLSVGYGLVKDPNSVAYANQTMIMSAAMAGGMIPPLGIAISTVLFPRQWTAKSKDSAKANWLMGACFISEGAIPFMIEDPKRIPVSAMIGGAISGAIIGALQVTIAAPHGGIFVVPLTNSLLFESASMAKAFGVAGYLLAVVAGSVAMGIVLGFWRLADIKSGKLALATSNGVKESIEAKIAKFANNESKLAKYNEKLNKYNKFEQDLKAKQLAYQNQMTEKAKLKASK
ncbi:PTS fructose transporter subunit IIABC [Spiroplasma culicicola]|uniref:PTS system fructose-specific IIABC component n=1 Tax=Spiroplasma culicicola AES-1 TaxID=1276246 RepID=W6A758_9MOLU|nr:fructose-specific PTS transporter subunit EIIC [Spiroplasma culicicola]AHI52827.1 PTS system fructose-specific IIABC component [Spiroplasma culicicola AES-1]